MSLKRISLSTPFTTDNYNANMDALEKLSQTLGSGVILDGLQLSSVGGLNLAISDGTVIGKSAVAFTSIPNYLCPSNTTIYLWLNEDTGLILQSPTYVAPSTSCYCLGQITTSGVAITSITDTGREEVARLLCKGIIANGDATFFIAQGAKRYQIAIAGYISIILGNSNISLSSNQYLTFIIELTGTLTGNVILTFPKISGLNWRIVNSTSGAFTASLTTSGGTPVTATQGKSADFWCDGSNIRRGTPDI